MLQEKIKVWWERTPKKLSEIGALDRPLCHLPKRFLLDKGDAGNAILNTLDKTASVIFLVCNKPIGVR